jgi:tetratricopeptide (TPR) repeat protein
MENLKKSIELAVDAYKAGNLSKAEEAAKKLIDANPKVVFLYNFLGLISAEQKKIDIALKYYEDGVKLDHNFPLLYNNMGLIYANNKNDPKKAEMLYKKSISLDEKIPEPHNNLGSLYQSLGKFNESIDCFKKAISFNDKFAHSYHNLGNVYVTVGNFLEAKKCFNTAIDKDPNYSNSHRALSRLTKYTKKDKHFFQMNNVYKNLKNNDVDDRINICFALGKANEDIKEYEKSFTFYKEGNEIYRKKINFSIEKIKEMTSEIKKCFNKKMYEKYDGTGYKEKSPIFIVGMPRSGTTLIEQIISNHPDVFACDEQFIIPNIIKKNFSNDNANSYFSNFTEFDKENLKFLGQEYAREVKKISKEDRRTTDKFPANFFWIGFIKLILPNSKIVHCYRNPRDNCLSIYKNHFPGGNINYGYSLNEVVKYFNLYNDLIAHWNKSLPDFVYNVNYEKLIDNPDSEIRKLINFCDLKWNPDCLNFHQNKRAIRTASDVQARSKLYSSSIDSWKNYEKHLSSYFKKLLV